ncbi:LysM peptidoglycan-binding domain-containing M23 family metallopeptidase [Ideonella dechloratans]|uniref:LysM peptidoglycan-binding domain-containing M23 family metallopeptidase n=1 Tax=Ideonella dechloratans TaxID=36863 RepID=A0A643FIP0_IDEDE|nr:LysM peptidoglycan-binding domain-containing protein [Ideonella dechloratans]KAB0585397.1 LysM peptidoglycan-binding domain-containing M23 family metallopeptidase [Ideonella dechloratans]UFU09341.1 LysM peptidoglycan-binding domain-containing protein [Ideonella dechloratans]
MSTSTEYTVKDGDTLWGISRRFDTSVDALSQFNGLTGAAKHVLHIGQKIRIPDAGSQADSEITLRILDLAFRPLSKPALKVDFDGTSHEITGDSEGTAGPLLVQDHAKGLQVHLRNPAGQYDLIAKHDSLPLGKKLLTLTSRKMLVRGQSKFDQGTGTRTTADQQRDIQRSHPTPHLPAPAPVPVPAPTPVPAAAPSPAAKPSATASAQTKPAASTAPAAPASSPVAPAPVKAPATQPAPPPQKPAPVVKEARVEGGKPQQAIGTVFTEANLLLTPANEKYRKLLIASAKQHGLTPHALAALVNAEASKLDNGEWNANAKAGSSSAAGLTQFLKTTWLQVATDKRSAVNQMLKKAHGFEQVNGQWSDKDYSIYGKTGKTKTPIDSASVLKLRFEPSYSIDAAAVYGLINMDALRKADLNVDALAPEDLAKLMYLAHHEGAGGAADVIKGQLTEDRAAELLPVQIGASSAKELAKRFGGKYVQAYPYWLYGYIDSKINVTSYMVNPGSLKPRSMADIASVLKGAKPPKPAPKPAAAPAAKPAASTAAKPTPSTAAPPPSATPGSGKLVNPLKTCVIRSAGLASAKSATFGMVRNGGTRAHQGIDLQADVGTPVYAIADGKVIAISKAFSATTNFGASVLLQVDVNDLPPTQRQHYAALYPKKSLIYFFYAHLSAVDITLGQDGTRAVAAGTALGKTGDSGNAHGMSTIAKGGHLHFEARYRTENIGKGLDGRLDPLPFIASYTMPQ